MGNALSSLCTPFPDDFYESVLSFAVASSRQPMLTTQDEIECHSYDSSLSLFCLHSLSFPPPLSLSLLILIVAHYPHSLNTTLFAYFLSISPPSWKYNESNNWWLQHLAQCLSHKNSILSTYLLSQWMNTHKNPVTLVFLSHSYNWESWDLKMFSDLPKVTKLAQDEAYI